MRRLDRPHRIALVAGVVLALGGAALALLAPEPPVVVPTAPGASPDAPGLRHLFSLPGKGDPQLVRPVGIAVGDERVYVADSGAGLVRTFSVGGADAGAVGTDVLAVPAYVAADPRTGTLLVSDRDLRAVLRFDADGSLLEEVRPAEEPTGTWEPLGLATDSSGVLAITDTSGDHRVVVLDALGATELEIGGHVSVEAPGDVAVSLEFPNSVGLFGGQVWVADSNNRRILVFDRATGDLERVLRIDGVPRGITFIGEGSVLRQAAVVDPLSSEIVLVDESGVEVARFGGPGTSEGRLSFPNDVAYDSGTRRLYVADTGNARVQVWEVVSAEERAALERAASGPLFSAMRIAGFGLIGLGVVLVAMALAPRRRG